MRLHKFRGEYWSCGDLSKWIYALVDVKKPNAASADEWDDWNDKTQSDHPFVYWVVEEFLGQVQDILSFPKDIFNTFQTWFRYSFIKHTPIINSGLKRGEFCSAEELILHGMFAVLVDFVECEKANMYIWCHKEEPKPWWMRHSLTRWAKLRRPDLGLKYLEWEVSLGEDSPYQAEKAQEVIDLYNWWTIIRPNREDPYDISGLDAYYKAKDEITKKADAGSKTKKKFRFNDWLHDGEKDEWRAMSNKQQEIEEYYEEEDTHMLKQLIEIRKGLWT